MQKSTNDSIEKKVTKRTKKEDNLIDEVPKKTTKKDSSKKSTSKTSTKKTSSSKTNTTKKEKTNKKTSTTKKSTASKTKITTKKTTSSTKTKTRKTTKKEEFITNLEYYDLPYRYNQTLVKILAQTPNTLFIYWDISDEDRKNLEETYGSDFFYNTKPVLIIHNETKNYSFEVEINDFANSWYLHISDTDCQYTIELGRRFFKLDNTNNDNAKNTYQHNNYIYISSSNKLVTPNDRVLLNFTEKIQYKNIKNGTYFTKEIKNIPFINSYDFYKEIYSEETLNTLPNNPSSNFKK